MKAIIEIEMPFCCAVCRLMGRINDNVPPFCLGNLKMHYEHNVFEGRAPYCPLKSV